MCRYGITADTAFATLGRVSQAHNLKLRALWESVIATVAGSNQPMPREVKTALEELSDREKLAQSARRSANRCVFEQTVLGTPILVEPLPEVGEAFAQLAGCLEMPNDLPGQLDAVRQLTRGLVASLRDSLTPRSKRGGIALRLPSREVKVAVDDGAGHVM